jgi:uncharacterized repeat protein (TIGR01451 family)
VLLRRFGALVGATLLTLGMAVSVLADAANPDVINVQVTGTTVTLSGTWSWVSRTGEGCDAATDRMVGWAVDWGDPNAPGNDVPGKTSTDPHWSVGTPTDNTVHTNLDCGTIGPDNYPIGTWGPISHTYTQSGDYTVCVLMYDIFRTGRDLHIVQSGNHSIVAGGPDRNRDNSSETNGLTPTGATAGPCIAANFHISAISIEKTASSPTLPAGGGPETYTYTVTNLGVAPLSNIAVTDDRCAPVTFVDGDANHDSKLDTTETWTYTCDQAVTATVTNTGTVTGQDLTNNPPTDVTASATATVEVAAATPAPPTAAPTPGQSVLAATGQPHVTLPPTDAIGGSSTLSDAGGFVAVIGLLTLVGSLLVPMAVRTRRRARR